MVGAVAQPRSVPFSETFGEELWQSSCTHQRLRARNVIGNTAPLHRTERTNRRAIIASIPEHPTCTGITIARLPNRSNVDQ
jgi:hypothetical protein